MKKPKNENEKQHQEQQFLDQLQKNLLPKMQLKEKCIAYRDNLQKREQKLYNQDSVIYISKRNQFISLQSKIDSIQNNLTLDKTNYDGIQLQKQEELMQLDYQSKYDPINIDKSRYKKLNFQETYKQLISTSTERTIDISGDNANSNSIANRQLKNISKEQHQNSNYLTTNRSSLNKPDIQNNNNLERLNTQSNCDTFRMPNSNTQTVDTCVSRQRSPSSRDSISGFMGSTAGIYSRKRSQTKSELVAIYPTPEDIKEQEINTRERQIQENNISINSLLYPLQQGYLQHNTFLQNDTIMANQPFEDDQAKRILKNIERYQNHVIKPSNCARSKKVPKMLQDRTLRLFSNPSHSNNHNYSRIKTEVIKETTNPLTSYFSSHSQQQQNTLEKLGYPLSSQTLDNHLSNNLQFETIPFSSIATKQYNNPLTQNTQTNLTTINNNNYNNHNEYLQQKDYLENGRISKIRENIFYKKQNEINQVNGMKQDQNIDEMNYLNVKQENDEEERREANTSRYEMEMILKQHCVDEKSLKNNKKQQSLVLPDITSPMKTLDLRSRERQHSVLKSTRSQSVAQRNYSSVSHSRVGSPFNKKCHVIYQQCCDLVEI